MTPSDGTFRSFIRSKAGIALIVVAALFIALIIGINAAGSSGTPVKQSMGGNIVTTSTPTQRAIVNSSV